MAGPEPKWRRRVYNWLMGKSFQRVLACLLMLAIPLQGFAAAAMRNCVPGHHGDAARADAHASAHVHAAAQDHDHAAHVHHGDAGHDDQAAPDAAGDYAAGDRVTQPSANSAHEQFAKGKCSACATCCSAAAIISATAVPAVFAAGTAPLLVAPGLDVSFITDGPSRPPRSTLA